MPISPRTILRPTLLAVEAQLRITLPYLRDENGGMVRRCIGRESLNLRNYSPPAVVILLASWIPAGPTQTQGTTQTYLSYFAPEIFIGAQNFDVDGVGLTTAPGSQSPEPPPCALDMIEDVVWNLVAQPLDVGFKCVGELAPGVPIARRYDVTDSAVWYVSTVRWAVPAVFIGPSDV